jgi:oligopeptide/dipeptide ABC transporter ATP-binding protein
MPLLVLDDLSVEYRLKEGAVKAVRNVTLSLEAGEIIALVGESGAGKTTAGLSVLGILPRQAAITSGHIRFEGQDLETLKGEALRSIRGDDISMIFQDPVGGLNPIVEVGQQVEEVVSSHREISKREAHQIALEALAAMRLPDPDRIAKSFPRELSGGMCQRIMIAIATVLNPKVLIADKPTAALDVTVQAQILDELERLRRERGTAILLITHDMGIVAQIADRVTVMYAGAVAEAADVQPVFKNPWHPYTWALLDTLPRLDVRRDRRLVQIPGAPPDLIYWDGHCAFLERCPKALTVCRNDEEPPVQAAPNGQPGHRLACYNPVTLEAI